jgi:hypothetical protein
MPDHIKINKDTSQTLWRLWGQWTSEEINAVESCLEKYVVRSSYPWLIKKDNDGFAAIRGIVNGLMIKAENIDELITKIDDHYRDDNDTIEIALC